MLSRDLEQIPGGTDDVNLNLEKDRSIPPGGLQRSPSQFSPLDLCMCRLRFPVKFSLALHMRETISLARHSCTHCYIAALAYMPCFFGAPMLRKSSNLSQTLQQKGKAIHARGSGQG